MASYIVSGAGTAAYNGTYVQQAGLHNGANWYQLDSTHILFWDGGSWDLSDSFGHSGLLAYYTASGVSGSVATTGWQNFALLGLSPPPTVALVSIAPAAPTLFPDTNPGPHPSITIDTPTQPAGADTYCDIQYSDDGGSTWHDWDTANFSWLGSRTYNWPSPIPLVPGGTYSFRCVAWTSYHVSGSTPGTAASCTMLGPIQPGGGGWFMGP